VVTYLIKKQPPVGIMKGYFVDQTAIIP